jgi:mannan endo-1,4-beta-mannosidase
MASVVRWSSAVAILVVGVDACGHAGRDESTDVASLAQHRSPAGTSPAGLSDAPPAASGAAGAAGSPGDPATEPLPGPPLTPDDFAAGEGGIVVVSVVHADRERHAISPLIYGMNSAPPGVIPQRVLAGVTFLRRGGDRCNAYNWETNVSNGALKGGYANDAYLARDLASPNAPGELDRELIASDIAGGRGTLVPFVLNGYVAGQIASEIPFTTPGWNIDQYFRKVELSKPTPFAATPDLTDGVVYTDEQLDFLRRQFPGDIYGPGPTQVMVGSDNEPDLYAFNFPMLQRGSGAPLSWGGTEVGTALTGAEFTQRFLTFARRVKLLAPKAAIVGPDHYHYDGFTTFHNMEGQYSDAGRWYMDDFLATVRAASDELGARLLDTWDFHWYPQRVFDGTFAWALDAAARPMTSDEITAVVQGPRSYWDPDYDEHSWITDDHLHAPAKILVRLQERIAAGYPGTGLGVTEYFPGGCSHVSSGLAVADSLGVFGKVGIQVAAMWPHTCDLTFAFGGFSLLRNADGAGLRFGATSVAVDHPEKAESSVYAATDGASRVTVLVVNKTDAPRSFGLRIYHPAKLHDVAVYRIDAAHPIPALAEQAPLTKLNAYAYAAPPMSAALLVFRAE